MAEAHEQCVAADKHICQKPSGRQCIEDECTEAAGTWWGPYWCPEHDKQRLDRISLQLENLLGHLENKK
jgi:hypothetical protein